MENKVESQEFCASCWLNTYYKCNIEECSCNYYCRVKARNITYSKRVSVVLVVQHAIRMLHIILLSVIYLAVPYFSILSYNLHDFWGKNVLDIKYVVCFYVQFWSKTFHIVIIIRRDNVITVHMFPCKVHVILVRF